MSEEDSERSQGRAKVETQRRRRRGDATLSADRKLPIPPEVQARLDREGLQPRWVNDEGNRVYRLTVQDDYDKVDGVEPVPVGTNKDGSPILAHLLAKRKDFVAEDRANAEKRRMQVQEALFRKPDAAADVAAGTNPDNPTIRPVSSSFVAEGSKISRGNQVLDG